MSGGKGGSTTSSVEIPEYIEAAAQRNLNRAERIAQLGYVPYYGPDVAALTPMQQASMENVAGAAGAYGMAAPTGQDIYGMPAATTYAGGIQGYSSAPMFEQAQAELAARRPAQKSYIDSFFIDPFTGAYGSNVQPQINYSNYPTAAQQQRNQQAIELAAVGGAAGSALSQADFNQNIGVIASVIGDPSYDGTRVLTPSERLAVAGSPAAQMAQDTIYMNQLGNANNTFGDTLSRAFGSEPSFSSPSSAGSYGGSLVTGELSGKFTPIPGFLGTVADTVVTNVAPEYAMGKQTGQLAEAYGSTPKDGGGYNFAFTPATTPTNTALAEKVAGFQTYTPTVGMPTAAPASANQQAAPMPMTYGDDSFVNAVTAAGSDVSGFLPPTGGSDDGGTIGQISPTGQDAGEGFEWKKNDGGYLTRTRVSTPAPAPAPAASSGGGGDDGGGGSSGGGGGGCVVATHAVNSGAFTPSMKREAVVWCMHNLHDKWWGEAIRRGYRHLGRKKIEQGKAHEHYQEFRNYIDFASGKKRTIKGAIHFAARTVQFFAVGLVKGDA